MQKIQRTWNKIAKIIVSIPIKSIIIAMTLSGVSALMCYIPQIAGHLKDTSNKLENDYIRGIITFFIDINTLTNEAKVHIKIIENLIFYLMLSIFILCIIIIIIKCIYANKELVDKLIIGHSSMSQSQFSVETDGEYKVEYIDLIDDMKDTTSGYDKIKYAVNKQDKFVDAFKRNIDDKHEYGYMGIAHTPLILRMGNQIGDEVAMNLFHKSRTEGIGVFEELNKNDNFKDLTISTEVLDKNSDELIVGLSTTFTIKYDELNVFEPDDKNILIFSSEELGYDVIESIVQVKHYVKYIMDNVRRAVKDKNITKIHMILSTSSVMTFALGQAISLNNDPNVTIYHYDINNPRKYTWGIDLSKGCDDCLVVTNNLSQVND